MIEKKEKKKTWTDRRGIECEGRKKMLSAEGDGEKRDQNQK